MRSIAFGQKYPSSSHEYNANANLGPLCICTHLAEYSMGIFQSLAQNGPLPYNWPVLPTTGFWQTEFQ